jgi:phage terminase large subunit-like protein
MPSTLPPEQRQLAEQRLADPAGDAAAGPEAMRCAALDDLYRLMTCILNRPDINSDFLHARCREVQAAPDGYLDLWAREHYKSTIITIGKTIQDILRDPEITVGVFSHTRPVAKSFLRQIKREFESNTLLQELFPHIIPPQKGEKRTWSEDDGLIVRRRTNPKEATIEAWGLVDGQPTGKHFSLLIYDDVVTLESVTTPEMIKKTTDAWRLSLNLGARGGRRRMIGTRYHANDTYAELLKQGSVIPRLYPATVDGTMDGVPVFLTPEALAGKRRDMGPYVFACQMLQNPLADSAMGFREEWLRYWEAAKWDNLNLYIVVDPAGEKKKGSDYTVMWVIGLGPDGIYYVVDGIRDRLSLTQKTTTLMRLHRRYHPIAVGYEKYGMQADIEHIRYEQDAGNYHFEIIELGGAVPKNDRIRRLVPVFEQRRMYLPGHLAFMDAQGQARNLTREFVDDEYTRFPVAGHDDMLDCMARILDPELGAVFPALYTPEEFQHKPPLAEMDWRPW